MQSHLKIQITSDGSATIFNEHVGENYHSKHGAYQESKHVFVDSGLKHYIDLHPIKEISILEIGFGTGLNFILSAEIAKEFELKLTYRGIEKYPVENDLLTQLSYQDFLKQQDDWMKFTELYALSFEKEVEFHSSIQLRNYESALLDFQTNEKFDIVYFDAFAAIHQPEMWSKESIEHACSFLKDKGIFVTYSVTGELKRNLRALGFEIERPQGAAGKREMMRATKNLK